MSTWDLAALSAVKEIVEFARKRVPNPSLELLRQEMDSVIDNCFAGAQPVSDEEWIVLGATAFALGDVLGLVQDSDGDFCIKTARFVAGKQRDYGTENISRFGSTGIIVRMHDKVARLENLRGRSTPPANETLNDTIMDMVGYAIVGILWARGSFFWPLADEKLMTVAESDQAQKIRRVISSKSHV